MLLLVKTPQRTELDLTWMTPYWKPALIVWEIHISCWGKKQSIVLPSWDAYNRSNNHYDKIDPQIPRCVMDKLMKIFSYRKTYSYKRSNDKLMDNFKKNLPEENLMLLFREKDIVRLPQSPHLYAHGLVHLSTLIGEFGFVRKWWLTKRPTTVNMQRRKDSGVLRSKCSIISNFPVSGLITEEDVEGLLLVVISFFFLNSTLLGDCHSNPK